MREYRCPHAHPDFPKQCCRKMLLEADFEGQIVLACGRCHRYVTIDSRAAFTSAQVDKAVVTV